MDSIPDPLLAKHVALNDVLPWTGPGSILATVITCDEVPIMPLGKPQAI